LKFGNHNGLDIFHLFDSKDWKDFSCGFSLLIELDDSDYLTGKLNIIL